MFPNRHTGDKARIPRASSRKHSGEQILNEL